MTREEAIRCLSVHSSTNGSGLCTDEQHYEAKQMAIQALEQEPCEDAISRQAVLAIAGDSCLDLDSYEDTKEFCDEIKGLPPVIPKQKTGHWIFVDKAKEHAHCSECDYGNVDLFDGRPHNYCPNCGTRLSLLKPYLPDICVGNMSEIPTGSLERSEDDNN